MSSPFDLAQELVSHANRVVFLTGAGLSTASGIPDYRGPDGVWTKNPEAEKKATITEWMNNADVRRAGWQRRLNTNWDGVEPNAAHYAITAFDHTGRIRQVVTQNIDGLHQRSGLDIERLIEIHGTIHESICMSCRSRGPIRIILERVSQGELDPHCTVPVGNAACGGILKAATISFGQSLIPADLEAASEAIEEADLLIAVGSTLAVYPVAGLVPHARDRGVPIIIMNNAQTEMDLYAAALIRGDITTELPRLLA